MNHLAQTSQHPFVIDVDRAEGVYIYDKAGKKYIDFISGVSVSNLGHNHPEVKKAVIEQVNKYMHVMVYGEYNQDPQIQLADALTAQLPQKLNSVYFVNSGTEANEGALKLAKRVTGRSEIVSFNKSYHGSTHGSLSVSGNEMKKYAYRPLLPGVRFIDFNEKDQLKEITSNTAGVIVEPIQGDAGVRIPDHDYLQALRDRCDEVGALLIFDEIQTGFGRTGKLFAFEHWNVVPDVLTIAKGMGGGMPIGAFVSSHKYMHELTYNPPLGHITTFGGHPVNCAAALATINVMTTSGILDVAEEKGKLIEDILNHPKVIEIRRKGLFFAIELENPELVQKVVEGCKNKGVLSYWFLSCPESFRIAPPITTSVEEAKIAANTIREVLDDVLK